MHAISFLTTQCQTSINATIRKLSFLWSLIFFSLGSCQIWPHINRSYCLSADGWDSDWWGNHKGTQRELLQPTEVSKLVWLACQVLYTRLFMSNSISHMFWFVRQCLLLGPSQMWLPGGNLQCPFSREAWSPNFQRMALSAPWAHDTRLVLKAHKKIADTRHRVYLHCNTCNKLCLRSNRFGCKVEKVLPCIHCAPGHICQIVSVERKAREVTFGASYCLIPRKSAAQQGSTAPLSCQVHLSDRCHVWTALLWRWRKAQQNRTRISHQG